MTTNKAERTRRLKVLETKVDILPEIIGDTSELLKLVEEYKKLTCNTSTNGIKVEKIFESLKGA